MAISENTASPRAPQPLPRFVWPKPGDDVPRLPWSDWLKCLALQLGRDYPGPVGRFLSAHVGALALQSEGLRATDPEGHEELAAAAAIGDAAWLAALEQAAEHGGHWQLGPDPADHDCDLDLGGWGAHPDEGAYQAWIATDPSDETWCN